MGKERREREGWSMKKEKGRKGKKDEKQACQSRRKKETENNNVMREENDKHHCTGIHFIDKVRIHRIRGSGVILSTETKRGDVVLSRHNTYTRYIAMYNPCYILYTEIVTISTMYRFQGPDFLFFFLHLEFHLLDYLVILHTKRNIYK